jgi:hypothetical protein
MNKNRKQGWTTDLWPTRTHTKVLAKETTEKNFEILIFPGGPPTKWRRQQAVTSARACIYTRGTGASVPGSTHGYTGLALTAALPPRLVQMLFWTTHPLATDLP